MSTLLEELFCEVTLENTRLLSKDSIEMLNLKIFAILRRRLSFTRGNIRPSNYINRISDETIFSPKSY